MTKTQNQVYAMLRPPGYFLCPKQNSNINTVEMSNKTQVILPNEKKEKSIL
jgi:hypothetical protein